MRNHIVKQCQANDGADNTAGNCVQCARGQDGTSWTLQAIVGDPEGFRWQSHPPFSSEGYLWSSWQGRNLHVWPNMRQLRTDATICVCSGGYGTFRIIVADYDALRRQSHPPFSSEGYLWSSWRGRNLHVWPNMRQGRAPNKRTTKGVVHSDCFGVNTGCARVT